MQRESHVDSEGTAEWSRFVDAGMPKLIEHYNFVHALFAFVDSGMARRITGGATHRDAIGAQLEPELVDGMLRYLTIRGVLKATPAADAPGAKFSFTDRGAALCSELSFAQMGFYREAYGPVLENMSGLLQRTRNYPADVQRDGAALGRHCAFGFHYWGTSVMRHALSLLDARSVLDLGCGGAAFLIDVCKVDPAMRGVGLDISAPAIEYARGKVAEAGLTERIELFVGDAFMPDSWPQACRSADAVMTVGTLHEQFRNGEQAVITLLDRYATLMRSSGVKGIVVGEPEVQINEQDADFYLMHVYTRQGLPRTRDQWLSVIEKSQLRCEHLIDVPRCGPPFVYFVMRPR